MSLLHPVVLSAFRYNVLYPFRDFLAGLTAWTSATAAPIARVADESWIGHGQVWKASVCLVFCTGIRCRPPRA